MLTWLVRISLLGGFLVVPLASTGAPPPRIDPRVLAAQPQGGARGAAAQWRRSQHEFQHPVPAAGAAPAGLAHWRGALRPWQWRQGQRIVEGDIALGPPPRRGEIEPQGLGLAGSTQLWLEMGGVVQIPYVVTQGNAELPNAIAEFNSVFAGSLQWVPHSGEADYVDIVLDPDDHSGTGFSAVGRIGARQVLGGSIDMNLGTWLHEMGHAAGLQHEQSRSDRDAHVTIHTEHVIGSTLPNFEPIGSAAQPTGLYDIASRMHYGADTLSKDGEPTIESIPPGMPIAAGEGYSAGDVDALLRLYQRAPSQVTVTSNPPGLQVIVDGVTRTTPYTFKPALESTHTLDVPAGPQTLAGVNYVYGRWNDQPARAHTVTIGRGSGRTGAPVNRPAVGVYQASFVELVPYAPWVWPEGAGSVSADPPPQAYPPLAGLYHVRREPVTLQATAQPGYGLYRLYTIDGGVSENPKTTRWPEWVLAYFASSPPLTTIASQPARRWVWVDGAFWIAPVSFAPEYDSGWGAGSMHQVDVDVSPQLPYSWSIRYPWQAWSDGGGRSHAITVPGGASTLTASFGTEYNLWAWAQQPCAGSLAFAPPSADGFYPAGTVVSVGQSTVPGWLFTGWQRDLAGAGTQNPAPITMSDEHIVVAGYNTAGVPIAIGGLSPAYRVAGQGKFTLAIGGAGFTADTRAWVNGVFRTPKSAAASLVKLKMKPADTASPGTTALVVDNLPPGSWTCSAYALAELPVLASGAVPLAAVSPDELKFGKVQVGATSAPQVVTIGNPGSRLLALHDTAPAGGQAGDFVIGASTCTSGLAAGASCTVELRFAPQAIGVRASRLLVIDSAFDSPQAVTLSGTGK